MVFPSLSEALKPHDAKDTPAKQDTDQPWTGAALLLMTARIRSLVFFDEWPVDALDHFTLPFHFSRVEG